MNSDIKRGLLGGKGGLIRPPSGMEGFKIGHQKQNKKYDRA